MGEKFQVLLLANGVPDDEAHNLSATKLLAR